MRRFEPVLDAERPDAILVVGDVNSTIACALVAAKKGVPVIHVEAGLRSHDRSMPEEVNRVLTDQLSDLLFTTERHARDNLVREGIDQDKIHFVGNVMIDTLRANLDRAVPPETTLGGRDLRAGYGVVTLHRPSNVDDMDTLERIITTLAELSRQLPLVFPLHPRTAARIESSAALGGRLVSSNIVTRPPVGYLEMLGLMSGARLVLTDSGGIQEETTALGVPCITMRENTERPITVEEGTNTVVGTDPALIRSAFERIMKDGGGKAGRIPEGWDGRAAVRIAAVIDSWLARRNAGG
jgi:UDP-N-acetylglucosamine 2-epimerase (non-hydrolysing)